MTESEIAEREQVWLDYTHVLHPVYSLRDSCESWDSICLLTPSLRSVFESSESRDGLALPQLLGAPSWSEWASFTLGISYLVCVSSSVCWSHVCTPVLPSSLLAGTLGA